MIKNISKYIYLILFISTIFLANWLIKNFGVFCNDICVIPVGFGIYAPSGVLAIGLSFTLRDLVQRKLGIKWTILAIILGGILSGWINSYLAIASIVAFLLSEMLDLFVYTPLQNKNLLVAVLMSNIVGILVDSVVFLWLAQISFIFLSGQIMGKFWMTLIVLPIILFIRKYD